MRINDSLVAANFPLSYKILGITVFLLCAMSLMFLVLFTRIYENRLIADYANSSFQISSLLGASLENAMLKRDIAGLQKIVNSLSEQPGINDVFVLNRQFQVRFSPGDSARGQILSGIEPAMRQGETDALALWLDDNEDVNSAVLRSIEPVSNKPACASCHGAMTDSPINGYLVIDFASGAIHQHARQAAFTLAAFGGAVVLFTIIAISWALRRLVILPLVKVGAASLAIGKGDLSARSGVTGGDEIGRLGRTLDYMASELGIHHEKLLKSRQFIQAVINAVPDGIRVIGPDYRIRMANNAYCQQQMTTQEDVIGKPCYRSSHGKDEPCAATFVTCPYAEFQQGQKQALKCRHQHITEEGNELFVEIYAGPLDMGPEGESGDFFVESIRDLSAQIAVSMEHRLSEIGHLATGVAHEIHNPLSSISLAIKSISADLAGSAGYHKISPYLQIVNDEIERCLGITQQLLILSQVDSTQPVLVDLDEVVREVLALLSYQAEESGIITAIESGPAVRVLAASSDMHMLVLNTVQNAFHAMPDGGKLLVSIIKSDGEVELSIQDTGCGVAPADAAKVFWPFWSRRADQSTGIGLGLSICRSIVKKYSGTINMSSTPKKGTTLQIKFPAADRVGDGKS